MNQLFSNFLKEKSGMKRYTCEKCPDKSYATKGNLRRHLEWECGKKLQFKCKYCNYACKYKFSMKRHMLRHNTEIGNQSF